MAFVIRCIGAGSGLPSEFDGMYLARYEPEAHDGRGLAQWTNNIAEAVVFESVMDVGNAWRHVPITRPVREDGLPNRPLTAYSIEIVRLPPGQDA